MSGHNKWSKIKHKKAASDAKKSKEFSKLARLITVESKKCSGDVNSPGLRSAIDKARGINMPNDNIDRAVQKGKTDTSADMLDIVYEAYGPGGVAIIISTLTDNKNRAAAEIKHLLSTHGIVLAEQGSAAWAFQKNNNNEWEAKTTTEITDEDIDRLEKLVDELEDHDDVQAVCTNAS